MRKTENHPLRTDCYHTNDRSSMFVGKEKTCPVCGTEFICHVETWVYKITPSKRKTKYYCRYTCWRKAAKEIEK